MAAVDHLVDALQLLFTGGASNFDPNASLGGVASSHRVRGLGAIVQTIIPALRIDNVFPACGEGVTTLTTNAVGDLVFTPPGGGPGTPVTPITGGSVIVSGSDTAKAIRVFKEAVLPCPSNATCRLKFVDILNGLFAQKNVTNAQRIAGLTTYRAVSLHAPESLVRSISLWTPAVGGSQAVFSLGLEPTIGTPIQTIANETTAPIGITWVSATSVGTALRTHLAGGAYRGVWIKRVFPPAGIVNPLEKFQLSVSYRGR